MPGKTENVALGDRVMGAFRLVILICLSVDLVSGKTSGCPEHCFCSKTLTSVNCAGKKLTDLPENIPKAVTHLYLDHNHFTSLPPYGFGHLPNLKYLDLRNNILSNIQACAFSGLPVLETVYLTTNKLTTLDLDAFNGTTSIKYISLSANMFRSIPPLGKQPALASLVLEGNSLTDATFPESYRDSKNFNDIVLSNNNIRSLDGQTFAALNSSGVRQLKISRNKIDTISSDAFTPFVKLQSLRIGWNPINAQNLQNCLHGLQGSSLSSLNIANISLGGEFPSSTFALLRNTTIRDLQMPNNKINTIPDRGFVDLSNLINLDLSGSKIISVSDNALYGLKSLNIFCMNDNMISDIPLNLPETLQKLYLNGNKVTLIKDSTFANLVNLQELYLGGNLIQSLEENAFVGLGNLQKLHLVRNNIATLPNKLFSSFVRLHSLELNKNNVKRLNNTGLFSSMTSLLYLNMADNHCSSLPIELFNDLRSLQYLHLENNILGAVVKEDLSGTLFLNLQNLRELYLDNNDISYLPDPLFRDLHSLKILTAKRNRVSGWGENLFKSPKSLDTIDFSYNAISVVNQTSLANLRALTSLNLANNPFACTCELRWFRDWMNRTTTRLPNNRSFTCNSPASWKGKPVLSFDRTKINCVLYTLYEILAAAAAGMIIMGVIFTLSYRKRWFIILRLYRMSKKLACSRHQKKRMGYEEVPGEDRTYDAYVSCAEEDYGWVKSHVLPGIDDGEYNNEPFGGNFKLYFEPRDSLPGKWEVANIMDNLESSRKALIVLSKNYISKPRHEFELVQILDNKIFGAPFEFIILKRGDLPPPKIPKLLQKMMEQGKFLEWDDNDDAIQHFNERLQERLMKDKPLQIVNV